MYNMYYFYNQSKAINFVPTNNQGMKKIFIINGGQHFAHSGGKLNHTIAAWDDEFFSTNEHYELQTTHVSEGYDIEAEVDKYLWADVVIYHFAAWWMNMPYTLKEYLDNVLTAGHRKGMYYSDGRKSDNPERNYGKGGLMQGRTYMVTTTWNAPETAFSIPGEFFNGRSVDDGVLFGFHRMHAFIGMEAPLESFHFHDVEKNISDERVAGFKAEYMAHLKELFQ